MLTSHMVKIEPEQEFDNFVALVRMIELTGQQTL